jgi:uncharacterized protein YcbX
MNQIRITGLYIYPVKSMKGIALQQAQLTPRGIRHDRLWMVVRANGRFVTQRDIPRMALVETGLNEDGVVLSMQGHGSITVPFAFDEGESIETRVWGDECQTVDQGEAVSQWLSGALGSEEPLRLVRMRPDFARPQNHPEIFGQDTVVDFADAAPFLVASEASLKQLNSVLESRSLSAVPMNRFRPNIVLRGLEPFAEHKLSGLSTESCQFQMRAPCERCVVTTIDQATGEKDPQRQPFKTLQEINPVPGKENAPAFAQYATLAQGDQECITVGDRFEAVSG